MASIIVACTVCRASLGKDARTACMADTGSSSKQSFGLRSCCGWHQPPSLEELGAPLIGSDASNSGTCSTGTDSRGVVRGLSGWLGVLSGVRVVVFDWSSVSVVKSDPLSEFRTADGELSVRPQFLSTGL